MRQLELLSMLADTGNMRAAGQRLNMTTSAVSKNLREAEELFAVQIFRRLPRGVVLTAAGQLIVQRARVLLLELSQLSDELIARGSGADEGLVIGAPPFIAWTWLPRLLSIIQEEECGLPALKIIEGRLGGMTRQFDAGDIDVLITMDSPTELSGLRPDGFRIEPIGKEDWVVVCSPTFRSWPALAADRLTWQLLREEPWILPPRPTNSRMAVEAELYRLKLPPIVPRLESLNAITNLSLVEQGLGLTLVPRGVLGDRLRSGRLVELKLPDLPPPVQIILVYRQSMGQSRAISALRAAAQRLYKV